MKHHFESLLRPLFREDANFGYVERNTDELRYRVVWKTPEEGRPNKHSRPIEICISPATREDYEDAPFEQDREEMDRRIVGFIERQLAEFDPHHDVPREVQVPAERWVITPTIASA